MIIKEMAAGLGNKIMHINSLDNKQPNNDKLNKSDKWNRFAEWIHCICVVTFDLELGQAMETVYPPHIKLSEKDKMNVCYLAFPDSNSGCMGDTQFHIRLRVSVNDALSYNESHQKFNQQCLPVQKIDVGHYWGFVYFRQIKDNTLPRGYFQKSFVILTKLPFINLFYELCSLIAPLYFSDGDSVLESVCENICNNWPPLTAGTTISLPIFGTVYQTDIPIKNSKIYLLVNENNKNNIDMASEINKNLDDENILSLEQLQNTEHQQQPKQQQIMPLQQLSSLHEIDIFRSFYVVLPHIHILWELVLTTEPIVVMGVSPTDCSHMVQSLTSMIAPLPYCAESRPYFTIHDSEFKEFTQRNQGPPSLILGVTNPFFAKTLEHWPHTIKLLDTSINKPVNNFSLEPTMSSSDNAVQAGILMTPLSQATTLKTKQKLIKMKNSSKILDISPGVYTQYKPFLQKDKNLIKKIMLGIKTKRPIAVQSAILRRHLLELTHSFMIPLERYMASLMPLQKDISPFRSAPKPNQFKQDDFLATLELSGPHLTSTLKGDWCGLYKKFFRSSNFKDWYETRYTELMQTLQMLQLQALSDVDLSKWMQGKHEVEIVDMILKLKQKLKICNETRNLINIQIRNETKALLIKHLEDMKRSLPDDLKTIFNN